jgi:hypothetical protein
MPDTGAPWNLPYPSPSDLVRDAPQAFEDLAEAVADGLDDAGSEGIGPNVVSVVKTDQFSLSATTTYTDVTGLDVTITPSTDTSKILVICFVSISIAAVSEASGFIRLTGGNLEDFVGDTSGSRVRAVGFTGIRASANYEVSRGSIPHTIVYLDSPATASPVTYKLQARSQTNAMYVNRLGASSDNASTPVLASSITAIEVKA